MLAATVLRCCLLDMRKRWGFQMPLLLIPVVQRVLLFALTDAMLPQLLLSVVMCCV